MQSTLNLSVCNLSFVFNTVIILFDSGEIMKREMMNINLHKYNVVKRISMQIMRTTGRCKVMGYIFKVFMRRSCEAVHDGRRISELLR